MTVQRLTFTSHAWQFGEKLKMSLPIRKFLPNVQENDNYVR